MTDIEAWKLVVGAVVKAKEGRQLTEEEKEIADNCMCCIATMKKDFMGRWYI